MSKFYLLAGLMILSIQGVFSQDISEFAPIGAVWHYRAKEIAYDYVVKYEVEKDTLFQGRMCRKINRSTFHPFGNTTGGNTYMAVEGNQVYHYLYSKEAFYLLYDFAANVGEQWRIELDALDFEQEAEENDWHGIITVDSVKWVEVAEQTLKKQYLSLETINVPENLLISWWFPQAIEFIGGPSLFTNVARDFPTILDVNCYMDNRITYKNLDISTDCEEIPTSINAIEKNKRYFSIFPNPIANKTIHLSSMSNQEKIHTINLYTMDGGLVQRITYKGESEVFISVPLIKSGVYYLLINQHRSTQSVIPLYID